MKILFRSFILLTLALTFFQSNAQTAQDLQLPLDPSVRYGKLDNGLTYYIKHNKEPENRASFYMIQNVGAILEDDNQNGLAHYLEHMAFNGTKHFPEKGILNTLERHGVKFGRNINAFTSQEETVYNLSEVPADRPGLLDTCLLVLHDWSDYLLLTEDEIEAERGVITEEWRTRRTASFRMYRASLPYIFNHSKYAERDVIGDIDVIKNFKCDEIRDFYHDWYRTDLQAVAIIGDFDADLMEEKVVDLFSGIPPVEDPQAREIITIPENDEIIYGMVTDKEADQTTISIYIRKLNENPGIENALQLRESYIEDLFNRVMSQRISELLQEGDPPFIAGNIVRTSLTRNYDATVIGALAKTNEEELALSSILEEAERVRQHGITPGELDRAKAYYLNRMENRLKERDKITNDQFAREYQSHFLRNQAFLDIETEFQLMKALFNSITPDDFTKRLPDWFSEKNNVMVIQGPESEDINHLNRDEAMAVVQASREMEVEPYEDEEVGNSLISEELATADLVSERKLEELDAEEWTLSNGARVVYRFADYEKDNISFRAYSPGGSSLFEAAYVPSMDMLSSLVPFYGVGEYDQTTLQKMLTGKTVSLNIELSALSEGMSGNASPKDFEMLMQLIYLRFTEPRFDEQAHRAIIGRYAAFVENMNKNPQKIMGDSLNLILTDHHSRTRIMDAEFINDITLDKIEKVYTDRYRDASDFTFFFVGNIQKEELLPYVEKYIGNIPDAERDENWIDREVNEPEGKVAREIEMELTVPKSTSILVLNNEMDYTPENIVMMRLINGILDLRFVESIREEEGGTYGVSSSASLSEFPNEKARLFIMFDTDPDKVDYLKGLVYEELESLVKEGPMEKDLSKARENLLKDREENRAHNSYWMDILYNYYLHQYNADDPENYEDIIRSVTAKDVKKAMKKLYKKANIVDLVFSPAEKKDES
ncbi:MAG: insulinase family protein [Bacteroidales bacterium]|nr:insulinase family protein [Bacteroidales bacterium]